MSDRDVETSPLRRSDLFAGLSDGELARIEALARERVVPEGGVIIKKGGAPTEFFALLEGEARIATEAADGREFFIRRLQPGDVFGEIAVFDRRPRTASVVATAPSRLAVFDARDLRDHLQRAPAVAIALLEVLAERVRRTHELLEDSVFLKVSARLAKVLLGLSLESGEDTGEGRRIARAISQGELARRVGTTREGINRQLSAWEKQGWLRREADHLVLLRMDRLTDLAPAEPE
ncbi:MAG: Crp/Fnr family transcriptional regulator [Myxococcota bacterium]